MMFAAIIPQVLRPGVPIYQEIFLVYLIACIKVSHFNHLRALPPDGPINDARRRCIVAMNGCGGLGMSQLLQDQAKNASLPHVKEERTQLHLRCRSGDKF